MKDMIGRNKGTIGQKERFKDNRHHVYQERKGWPEPTCCPDCGAVFVDRRWTWAPAPPVVNEARCPACRRIADNYPAGFIELQGPFLAAHRDEILHLIRNTEAVEKAEHPLERLMAIDEEGGPERILVTTTGIHLARRIGKALARAFQGSLTLRYGEDENSLRTVWER